MDVRIPAVIVAPIASLFEEVFLLPLSLRYLRGVKNIPESHVPMMPGHDPSPELQDRNIQNPYP